MGDTVGDRAAVTQTAGQAAFSLGPSGSRTPPRVSLSLPDLPGAPCEQRKLRMQGAAKSAVEEERGEVRLTVQPQVYLWEPSLGQGKV